MGFWSSVGSAIGSAFSAAGSAISSACSSVLSGIASVVSNPTVLMTALALAIPIAGVLKEALIVIDAVSKLLGILNKNESSEELGDRALQAQEAGIRPEDFPTYKDYVASIRNFEIDPKKSAEYSDTEKMVAGVGVQFWGYEDKFGVGSGDLLAKIIEKPDYFTTDRLESILAKVESVSDVVKYFDDKLSSNDRNAVEAKLVEAEKSLNPDKSTADIYKELDTYRHD